MKGNVNPFEPWRPTNLDVPPPLHAGRPWRPPEKAPARAAQEEPPLVEPVDPPAQKAPPKRPPKGERRRPAQPSARNTPVAPLRTDQKVVLGMFFALGILGLVGLAWLGGTHLPRIFTALLAVGVGFTIGISLAHRRTWFARLGWMAGALALAGLAGWFVPTTRGINLWSAYQQVDELRTLPAGDVAGFVRGAPARKEMIHEFPTFAEDMAAAEQGWLRRTVDAAIEESDQQLLTDPHKALAGFHRLNTELARLDHYARVRGELESARRRALQASLKAAQDEVDDLLGRKQFDAVAKRGAFWADELGAEAKEIEEKIDLPERLLSQRRQAVTARLEAARKDIAGLLAKDRFRAVADTGVKLRKDLGDEAKAVGMADDLDKVCTYCAAIGDLARQAERR